MSINFELGDAGHPRGHALIYMTSREAPGVILATYVVLLPVSVDIKKYVPPFLANQVASMSATDMTSFAFPPAPEPVEDLSWVRRTAELRGDDVINAGPVNGSDIQGCMEKVAAVVREYSALYNSVTRPAAESPTSPYTDKNQVDEVVYSLMSEADLLTELTTLTGRLRYAAEGGDQSTLSETRVRVIAISKRLPENRRIARLAEVAVNLSPAAADLAQLYLERGYSLYREDYLKVKSLDQQITAAESQFK